LNSDIICGFVILLVNLWNVYLMLYLGVFLYFAQSVVTNDFMWQCNESIVVWCSK